jgi:hypothetical protein
MALVVGRAQPTQRAVGNYPGALKMAKNKRLSNRGSRNYQTVDLIRDSQLKSGSGEGRRFLKRLDRRLQRFSHEIDRLEARASRLDDNDDADLVLAVESLRREALVLRAEIREQLAGGGRSLAEMTEYAEDSWQQLRDSYEELKENLEPEELAARSGRPREMSDEDEESDDWIPDEDEWSEGDDEWETPDVHPPRVGPKR